MDHSGDNNQWVAKESEGVEQIPPFSHLLFYNPVEGSIIRGQVFINYIPVVIPQRMIPKGKGSVTVMPPVNKRGMIDVLLF